MKSMATLMRNKQNDEEAEADSTADCRVRGWRGPVVAKRQVAVSAWIRRGVGSGAERDATTTRNRANEKRPSGASINNILLQHWWSKEDATTTSGYTD
ncbi:unnamed protein product [Soboliphyme baturini]|uniref:Uncharacterized protein n=1 Tax=Soboliphyme baturini TaxID=241478 RepID=A0A183IS88_9BILA|nr:unnamed protein product [Soboliphyme baturini]